MCQSLKCCPFRQCRHTHTHTYTPLSSVAPIIWFDETEHKTYHNSREIKFSLIINAIPFVRLIIFRSISKHSSARDAIDHVIIDFLFLNVSCCTILGGFVYCRRCCCFGRLQLFFRELDFLFVIPNCKKSVETTNKHITYAMPATSFSFFFLHNSLNL